MYEALGRALNRALGGALYEGFTVWNNTDID